ncbi:MAG TPA: aldo/keto reductase [Acidimicrobiales bacterium]|nr:aldo/keto reductase [Acidimicrobiales bacterium]
MIERKQFGRTGHASSRVIFGAAGLGRASQERADEALAVLDEFGVNHIDTAASYGDSELRIAPWMRTRRNDFFLATKTGDRSGAAARASLERSLERLGVDHVDLVQLHNLVEEDEWQEAHGPGGAVEALAAAREEGLTRFVGITGHGLRIAGMHLRSLDRFDFDSVLLPYSHVLAGLDDYRETTEQLLALCQERGVAVQTIKSVARRRWDPDTTSRRFSWYEPLPDGDALARAVRWVLSDERVFLNSSSDLTRLRPTLSAAEAGGPPDPQDLERDREEHDMTPLFDGGALERI